MRNLNAFAVTAGLLLSIFLVVASTSTTASDGSSAACTNCTTNGPACALNDYVAVYGPKLDNFTRLRDWQREAGANCTEDNITRPATAYVKWWPCLPGEQYLRRTNSKQCATCFNGDYLDLTHETPQCGSCDYGTTAEPLLMLRDGFEEFGGDKTSQGNQWRMWRRDCPTSTLSWDCSYRADEGFEFVSYHRGSQGGGNRSATVIGLRPSRIPANVTFSSASFSREVQSKADGVIEVSFSLGSNNRLTNLPVGVVTLSVDNISHDARVEAELVEDGPSAIYKMKVPYFHRTPFSTASGSYPAKSFIVQWTVRSTSQIADPLYFPAHEVVLLSLEVSGDVRGVAETCTPCPVGHACPSKSLPPLACAPGTYQPATHAQQCRPCTGNTVAPGYGYQACLACTHNRTANPQHTACVETCTYADGDVLYNFTAMSGVVLQATVDGGAAEANTAGQESRVFFSVCDAMPVGDADADSQSAFNDSAPCLPEVRSRNSSTSAYVCERLNATHGRHYGNVLEFITNATDGRKRLITSMGSLLQPIASRRTASAVREESTWRATIELECDSDGFGPNAAHGGSVQVRGVSEDTVTLRWRSPQACPTCTAATFTPIESRCSAATSTYTVTYERRTTSAWCVGGYVPPSVETHNCTPCVEEFYTMEWEPCNWETQSQVGRYVLEAEHAGCRQSDVWSPDNQTRHCSARRPPASPRARNIAAIIAAFVLALTGAVAAVALFPNRFNPSQPPAMAEETGMELGTFGPAHTNGSPYDDGYAAASAHYNVVGATEAEAMPTDRATSRFANLAGGVIASMSGALRRAGTAAASAVSSGRSGSPPLSGEPHGNGYNAVATTDSAGVAEDAVSSGWFPHADTRRNQVRFSLRDADDDDILPPSASRE